MGHLSLPYGQYEVNLRTTTEYFELPFLISLGHLANHQHHMESGGMFIQFVPCALNESWYAENNLHPALTEEEIGELPDTIEKVVSILNWQQHFVFLEMNVETKEIVIYDGFERWKQVVVKWENHVIYILQRIGMLPVNTNTRFSAIRAW